MVTIRPHRSPNTHHISHTNTSPRHQQPSRPRSPTPPSQRTQRQRQQHDLNCNLHINPQPRTKPNVRNNDNTHKTKHAINLPHQPHQTFLEIHPNPIPPPLPRHRHHRRNNIFPLFSLRHQTNRQHNLPRPRRLATHLRLPNRTKRRNLHMPLLLLRNHIRTSGTSHRFIHTTMVTGFKSHLHKPHLRSNSSPLFRPCSTHWTFCIGCHCSAQYRHGCPSHRCFRGQDS